MSKQGVHTLLSAALVGVLSFAGCGHRSVQSDVSTAFPYAPKYAKVEGDKMHYVEVGSGDPILLLHGNPTSSYLWRNIIPHLAPHGRVIAVDLIGMGRSDKPELEYRVQDHARYVEGFIDALDLHNVTFVVHDWGSILGFDYAARHPGNVKAIAFMEAITEPLRWEDASLLQRMLFKRLRHPDKGRKMTVDKNFFIEKFLRFATVRRLSATEMDAYREPFTDPGSREPMRVFPRELPFEGDGPMDVVALVQNSSEWLRTSSTPKLLLYAKPGMIISPDKAEELEASVKNLRTVFIGRGRHYVQEDQPERIGVALADWYSGLPEKNL
ncbi:MAG: haloalkane dehalogenase [Nannocystaceae bacterium]|nr:haloalkane dehalogenase [Nannocystaceae bacterium]